MSNLFLKLPLFAAALALTASAALADTPTRAGADPKALAKGVLKGTGSPDLIIEPRYAVGIGLPLSGYCGAWNGGNPSLQFRVRNIGSAAAPASDAYVFFGGPVVASVVVPALQPGQSSLRSVPVPDAAWLGTQDHSFLDFLIAADHNDDVPESNVTNNYGEGTCLGPAG